MKKTFKGALALAFCVVTVFATMLIASAISAPKAKVKSVTYNSVTITWSEVKGADGGYQVQRSTDGKKWTTLTSSTKSTSYTDKKLTTGKTYRYRVRAIDKGLLRSTYSSWSSVVKGKPVPAKVKTVKSSPTKNSVKLSWSKVSGASGYVVQRYSKKKWTTYKTTTKTSMTISKLTLGKTYSFRIRAYRTVSKKKVYGDYSSTIKTGPALTAPSSFVLKGVTSNSLTLAWSAVDGAKGYEVYNKATKKWTNTKTKRTLTVKNLKAGTKYEFIVRAYSGSYDGKKSATRTYITTPAKVSGVKASKSTSSALTFTWSKATGAAGYQPQYSADGKNWTSLSTTTGTSATVSSLKAGTKYYFRVRAYVKNSNVKDISATNYGSYSSAVSAYTSVLAPKTISLSSAATNSLKVTWTASTGATAYEIYNSKTGTWVNTGTTRSYTLSGLSAGTKYTFKVRALLNSTKSAESSSFSFITAPAAPTVSAGTTNVNGVIISASTSDTVTVSWGKVTGAAKYQIQYSADGSNWTSAPETTGTTATIKSLKAGTAYSVRVRAYVNNSGTKTYGAYSSAVSVRTLSTAKTKVSTASGTNSIELVWTEVSGAKGYVVERFDSLQAKDWTVFDFNDGKFKAYEKLTEDSIISTTETALADKPAASRAEIYRVRVVDANGYAGITSDVVTGDTADIDIIVGDYYTEIKVPAYENVASYTINSYYPFIMYNCTTYNVSELTKSGDKYVLKVALAPDSIHSLTVVAHDSSNKTLSGTGLLTVKTNALKVNNSDSASVNSQLLYLTQAINNTKNYQDKIGVKFTSSISTKCGDLQIYLNGEHDWKSEMLEALLGGLLKDELANDIVDNNNYNFTFTNGETKDENNVTVTLKNFIEPNTNSTRAAYLYNGNNPTAWSKGIKDFKSTKNSDGSLSVSFKLKQEKNNPYYHDGFLSVLNSTSFSQDGLKTEEVVVGETTVQAVIASDYVLKSYTANAPFTGKFSMSMTVSEDSNDSGVSLKEGDKMEFKIPITGTSSFSYTFTR